MNLYKFVAVFELYNLQCVTLRSDWSAGGVKPRPVNNAALGSGSARLRGLQQLGRRRRDQLRQQPAGTVRNTV